MPGNQIATALTYSKLINYKLSKFVYKCKYLEESNLHEICCCVELRKHSHFHVQTSSVHEPETF